MCLKTLTAETLDQYLKAISSPYCGKKIDSEVYLGPWHALVVEIFVKIVDGQ